MSITFNRSSVKLWCCGPLLLKGVSMYSCHCSDCTHIQLPASENQNKYMWAHTHNAFMHDRTSSWSLVSLRCCCGSWEWRLPGSSMLLCRFCNCFTSIHQTMSETKENKQYLDMHTHNHSIWAIGTFSWGSMNPGYCTGLQECWLPDGSLLVCPVNPGYCTGIWECWFPGGNLLVCPMNPGYCTDIWECWLPRGSLSVCLMNPGYCTGIWERWLPCGSLLVCPMNLEYCTGVWECWLPCGSLLVCPMNLGYCTGIWECWLPDRSLLVCCFSSDCTSIQQMEWKIQTKKCSTHANNMQNFHCVFIF